MDESFLKSLNVLYVEDEVDIIQLVEKRFAPKFNQFLSVTSAEEALEIFEERQEIINMVLIHMVMRCDMGNMQLHMLFHNIGWNH